MSEPRQIPAFVEVSPSTFLPTEKCSASDLRAALTVERDRERRAGIRYVLQHPDALDVDART